MRLTLLVILPFSAWQSQKFSPIALGLHHMVLTSPTSTQRVILLSSECCSPFLGRQTVCTPLAGFLEANALMCNFNLCRRYLRALFREAVTIFPDKYVFLGGDEVSTACWASNATVVAWLKAQGMPADASTLQAYFEKVVSGSR